MCIFNKALILLSNLLLFGYQVILERGLNKRCLCISDCSLLPIIAATTGFEQVRLLYQSIICHLFFSDHDHS